MTFHVAINQWISGLVSSSFRFIPRQRSYGGRSSRTRTDGLLLQQHNREIITNSTSRNFAKKNHSDNEIARVRADVENAIPRQSHDVASAPASRRRVERDASSNASRRVRAARSYRERGLLFFVLDACGRVRRRAAKRARYPKVRCVFVISVAHARFFRSGGGRKRARAERTRREARRKTRDRWPNARHHSVREKHRRDRLRSRHAPAAEATSRMGDVPVLLVYANPKAKPPPRHALASALWFRTSRLPTVISTVASGRRDARVAVPGLERTLATSTQRAAGESGAVRGVERSWLLFLAKSEKDPNESPIRAVFSWFQSRADPMKSWRFDRSDPMKSRAATDSETAKPSVGSGRTLVKS